MLSHYGLYAYGLIDQKSVRLDIPGIDKKHQIYTVNRGDVCVVVSDIDVDKFQSQIKDVISRLTSDATVDQQGATEIFQAHERVIDALMQHNTVVPLKFGTILKDEDAALHMLQEHEENFKKLLVKFNGKIEWGVKVYADKQVLINQFEQTIDTSADEEEKQPKLSKGTAYLLGKKKEQELKSNVTTRLAQIAEEIFQVLEKEACEAKINKVSPQRNTERKGEIILNAVFLVDKQHFDIFKQQGTRCVEKQAWMGVDLEFSGPWPPYNFT